MERKIIHNFNNFENRTQNSILKHILLPSATKLRRLCFYRCVSVHRWGGAIPACIAGGIPACLAAGLQGGCYPSMYCRWYPSMPCSRSPGGCLLLGGACSQGVPAPGGASWGVPAPRGCLLPVGGAWSRGGWCGLLLWPSVVVFCYGLQVWWPSD